MFLIAKGLGFLSRGKAAEKVCGVALTERRASLRGFAPASLPWVISSFLGELDQSLRYLRGPKEIDEKLMCSETRLPEPSITGRDLCIRGMEL